GNVNAVTVNVISFDDDVAKIDPNSILDPMMLRYRGVAANQVLLDHDAAANRFDGTVENRDESVPGGFDELAVMFCNAGFYQIALDSLDAVVGPFLVNLHQPAVAGDIPCNDRRQAARTWPARSIGSLYPLCL